MEQLFVQHLDLVNFKNHLQSSWSFNSKVNIITGNNGNGKTNVLDALHFLSSTKSYLGVPDTACISHGESMCLIKGVVQRGNRLSTLDLGMKKGQKKNLRVDGADVVKRAEHLGFLPVVLITPTDRDLITDASETRRKLADSTLAQNNRSYLDALMKYNRALSQRNTTLKYFASNRTFDAEMIAVYNEQLAEFGAVLYQGRQDFVDELVPLLQRYYQILSGGRETVGVSYKTALQDCTMEELLAQNLERDRVLQYTSGGVHRDDLLFTLGEHAIKRVGSQGQQKSFLIALKLAQFEITQRQLNMAPLLLLDDIFDKLDEHRVAHLLELVNTEKFGQIFITDTHPDRMKALSEQLQLNHSTFELTDHGEVQSI